MDKFDLSKAIQIQRKLSRSRSPVPKGHWSDHGLSEQVNRVLAKWKRHQGAEGIPSRVWAILAVEALRGME
jgi:hypothetical protein